ncbi:MULTISPECIES: glycosyltransferase family 4 protein [Methylomonas]|uniref:Glycosyl transferase family 1 domain-containing protein n=1 Tax=Methylomonas koyamae TaxID=702114 RepID=A0A177NH49_9GAMM|nr:glycosyltransferase family 4 protein [Methylomonas koyamae]OAI17182.1 hypothetical protein A1355_08390 [Methylomonas koyamae]
MLLKLVIHSTILLSAIFFKIKNKGKKNGIHFFFPFYHVGGGEKVHLQIVSSVSDYNPQIYFTCLSNDLRYLDDFKIAGNVYDLSDKLSKTGLSKYFYLGKIVASIGGKSIVFGANTKFFYLILPFLSKSVYKVDLIHAFCDEDRPGYEGYSIPYVKLLDKRVVINEDTKTKLYKLYEKLGLNQKFYERIITIRNYVDIPYQINTRPINNKIIRIAYIGRGSEEKRIYLIGKIASALKSYDYEVLVIGCCDEWVLEEDRENCIFLGKILNNETITEAYNNIDAVLITSYREGSPLALMESMSHGAIPISTNVGGISEFITDGYNGFLVKNHSNEDKIVDDFVSILLKLFGDHALPENISNNCYNYSKVFFDKNLFIKKYRTLLLNREY